MMPTDFVKPTQPVLTVSALTQAIKKQLETTFPYVLLKGEVSNFRQQSSGHLYFSLKDAEAQISAVMFRGQAAHLTLLPKEGDQVLVKGAISVFPPRGNYQILIDELEYLGRGALLQRLEELKRELHQRGWFRKEHKKPLPPFPKRIGVITSPTGAAIQDILHVLTRRAEGFHLILNPVKVQGEGAAEEIAAAIDQMNQHQLCDVMIVGRGGGSIEDLWPFNEEIVASAIYASAIPTIGAVGHETDHCIAEYVADVRAPTPSAAAEIVLAEKQHHFDFLDQCEKRLRNSLRSRMQREQYRLDALMKHPLLASPQRLLAEWMLRVDEKRERLEAFLSTKIQQLRWKWEAYRREWHHRNPLHTIHRHQERVKQYQHTLHHRALQTVQRRKDLLTHRKEMIQAIDPRNLISKGYTILFPKKGGSVIKSIADIQKGMAIRALLSDGEAELRVEDFQYRDSQKNT